MLPECKGAYILFIFLPRSCIIETKARKWYLKQGYYAYIGSSLGNGGIKARVLRHLRLAKKMHWHIDYLLKKGKVLRIIALCNAEESQVVEMLNNFDFEKIKDFGSSDSKYDTHLFKLM